MPTLHFVTNSKTPYKLPDGRYELRQSVAVLGKMLPLTKADLRRYVRAFPLAWVEA